jgi:hypothetical protein
MIQRVAALCFLSKPSAAGSLQSRADGFFCFANSRMIDVKNKYDKLSTLYGLIFVLSCDTFIVSPCQALLG